MEIWNVPVDNLIPYERNAKQHPPEQVHRIAESLRQFGWQQPIVIDKNNVVIIGHGRLLAAKEIGLNLVPCVKADQLTPEQVNALRLADNKLNESEWDFSKLEEELSALSIAGVDMTAFGFEDLEKLTDAQEVQEVETPAVPDKPKAKRGVIYRLGVHRLMCGDSTDENDVAKLTDGKIGDLLLTDPPYAMTAVNWDVRIDWDAFWKNANQSLKENAAMMLFSAQPFTTDLICSNRENFRYEIVWVKSQKTGFYNANRMPLKGHENICVFYRKLPTYNIIKEVISEDEAKEHGVNIGRTRHKKADRCVLYGHVKAQDYVDEGERYPCDVLMFSNWNGGLFGNTERATVHPTQKPLDLISYLLSSYSNNDDLILDLFGGSGSTLLACEQTGRKCYMMELDPHYVDVIIQRWETLTGQKAELIKGVD